MNRPADRNLLRSFVYVSDAKLTGFLEQIDDRGRRRNLLAKLMVSLGVNFGVLNMTVQSQPVDLSMGSRAQATQVAAVEDRVRHQFHVGDLVSGRQWISGTVNMEWAPLRDGQTVLFCGYAGSLLVALGGSVGHLRGRDSSADRTGSHSFAIRSAVLNGDEPEHLGRDLATAAREICITPQPVRFLAEVISRGLLPEGSAQREFVLATPLYVETVYTADEAVTRGQPLDPADPARIGRYQALRRLGAGSMGTVYLARDEGGTFAAIKVIRPEYVRDPEFLGRFRAEAENAQRVDAPNVAHVIEAVTDTEHPYLVTEFVDGPTLEEQVEQHGPLNVQDAISVSWGVAGALAAIARAGIVHRDLTPSNVILSRSGPKVIDFGIAHALGSGVRRTHAGRPVGTPAYMSPEQISEHELAPASDVFSWAGVTVFAVSGHQPFGDRDTPWTAMWRAISEGQPNLSGVPRPLASTVAAALSKNPARRPTAEQLHKWLSASSIREAPQFLRARRRARRIKIAGLVGALVAIAIVVSVLSQPSSQSASPPNQCPTWPSGPLPPGSQLQPGLVASSGTLATTLTSPDGYSIQDVAFSRDGSTIGASVQQPDNGTATGHVYLWNANHLGTPGILTDSPADSLPSGLAFSPTSDSLAVADVAGLDLWNLAACRVETASSGAYVLIDAVYAPDGKTIVTGDDEGVITMLNVPSGIWSKATFKDPTASVSGGSGSLMQVAVSPAGTTVADADSAGHAYVWDVSSGSLIGALTSQETALEAVDPVAFSPDGKTLAIADAGWTTLWDVTTHASSTTLAGPDTSPEAEAFSPNGTTLAVGDSNGHIYLWDVATHHFTAIPSPITDWQGLAFSPDGKTLAAFGYDSAKVYLYHIKYSRLAGERCGEATGPVFR